MGTKQRAPTREHASRASGVASFVRLTLGKIRASTGIEVPSEFRFIWWVAVLRPHISVMKKAGWRPRAEGCSTSPRPAVGLGDVPFWSSGFSLSPERHARASGSLLQAGHRTTQRASFTLITIGRAPSVLSQGQTTCTTVPGVPDGDPHGQLL